MKAESKKHQTGCLIAHGIDIFGDRWTLLIIRDMMLYGKRTYGDFLGSDEEIATNILASRLKHLEAEGIVEKTRDPKNGRSFIYRLTGKGLALAPVILEIIRWSGNHFPVTDARKQLAKRVEDDRDGFLAEIRARAQA